MDELFKESRMTWYVQKSFWLALFIFPLSTTPPPTRWLASTPYFANPAPLTRVNWGLADRAGVSAPAAWKVTKGSPETLVAVVDTGIDFVHPDLASRKWENPGETGKDKFGRDKATNGIDDDGNGLVDDVSGWDFVDNRPLHGDTHGHGTHISGIIAGRTYDCSHKNSHCSQTLEGLIGGVAPNVKLVGYRYYSEKSKKVFIKGVMEDSNVVNSAKALRAAIRNGARVINYSGGGAEPSAEELAVLKEAEQAGVLLVAAAGNEKQNTDIPANRYYPCSYQLSNIICVGNSTKLRELSSESNYGKHSIHIFAPGENIYSTLPNKSYGLLSGSSQSTAFVSGVAALIISKNPKLNPAEVIQIIINTADRTPSLESYAVSSGVVNASRAVAAATQPVKKIKVEPFRAKDVGLKIEQDQEVLETLQNLSRLNE